MTTNSIRHTLQLLTLGCALLTPSLFAAEPPSPPPQHAQRGPRDGIMSPEKRLALLTERLSLSTEQQAQIRPILAAEGEAIKALNTTEEQRRGQMNQIRKDTRAKIEAILTPEQIKLFPQDMRGPRNEKGPKGKRGEHPAGPPPPPPAPTS